MFAVNNFNLFVTNEIKFYGGSKNGEVAIEHASYPHWYASTYNDEYKFHHLQIVRVVDGIARKSIHAVLVPVDGYDRDLAYLDPEIVKQIEDDFTSVNNSTINFLKGFLGVDTTT